MCKGPMTIKSELVNTSARQNDIEDAVIPGLVWSYLVHNGYAGTAKAFAKSFSPSSDKHRSRFDSAQFHTMDDRKELTRCILSGDIAKSIVIVNSTFPQLVSTATGPSEQFFRLLCQMFVEYIRNGHTDEALRYAEGKLAPLASQYSHLSPHLQNVIVLLAYANPESSTVGHILSNEAKQKLADDINAAILGESEARLEKIIRHTTTVVDLLASFDQLNGTEDQPSLKGTSML